MRKTIKYIILAAIEIAFAFIYGLFLQEYMTILAFLIWAVSIPFISLIVQAFVSKKVLGHEILMILISSVLLGVLAIGAFQVGNKLYGEYVGEYEVTVEYISGRHNESVTVRLPNGETAIVNVESKLIYIDESEYVDEDDVILIREWKGLFGTPFYVFVEEIEDN